MTDMFPAEYEPAVFSPCRTWRYLLRRRWGSGGRYLGWCCLNPSTGNEDENDPSITRMIGFSKKYGYDGLCLVNEFAFVATKPADMFSAADPIGPENDAWIRRMLDECWGHVVLGWGVNGEAGGREKDVIALMRGFGATMMALSITSNGQPGHPLYIKGDAEMFIL